MKSIYLVVSSYFPVSHSSFCSFVYDQVCAIRRNSEYNVVVVNPAQEKDYSFRGIDVIGAALPFRRWLHLLPFVYDWLQVLWFLRVLRKHNLSIKDIKVVHCHQTPVGMYGIKLKQLNNAIKVLVQLHDADPFQVIGTSTRDILGLKLIVKYLRMRSILERVDACVAISKNAGLMVSEFPHQTVFLSYEPAVSAARRLHSFRPARIKKVIVLHNGVDRRLFFASDRSHHDGFRMGCFATCIPLKGYRYLFEAVSMIAKEIENWKLTIIGNGPELMLYKTMVDEKKLSKNVEFLSGINHDDMAKYFKRLDLYVMPSYFEALGCVYFEAFACGTPWIACVGQGTDDVIYEEDRNLWLAKPQDAADLAEKILYFYKFRPRQRIRGSYDIDVLVKEFLEKLEGVPV